MPKFIVELWLDGYDNEKDTEEACEEFIYSQLNFTASSVKIKKIKENNKNVNAYIKENGIEGNCAKCVKKIWKTAIG